MSWKSQLKYGKFRCHPCGRTWTSHRVLQYEMKQKCEECGVAVGPFRLRNLADAPKRLVISKRRHVRELCVACKRFGDCENPNIISDTESEYESQSSEESTTEESSSESDNYGDNYDDDYTEDSTDDDY